MKIKDIVREDSLSQLGIGDRPAILHFLDSTLKGLKQFKDDDYEDYIFFGKHKDDIFLQQDLKNDYFYVDYGKVWSVLESKYSLNYTDVQLLTKWYIETTYNLKGITTGVQALLPSMYIETTYNLKGITTFILFYCFLDLN